MFKKIIKGSEPIDAHMAILLAKKTRDGKLKIAREVSESNKKRWREIINEDIKKRATSGFFSSSDIKVPWEEKHIVEFLLPEYSRLGFKYESSSPYSIRDFIRFLWSDKDYTKRERNEDYAIYISESGAINRLVIFRDDDDCLDVRV